MMKCNDKNIKELLPAYQEQALDEAETKLVEGHCKTCADCRQELELLRMMAQEPVPDPGEAFWASMPGRVYREVQERKAKKQLPRLSGLLRGFLLPRWAWTTASVVIIAVGAWLLLRPAPEMPVPPSSGTEPSYAEVLSAEPVEVAELASPELEQVAQWADQGYAAIRREAAGYAPVSAYADVSADIDELNAQQLERLSRMLDAWNKGEVRS